MSVVEYREGIYTRFPRIIPASVGLIVIGILGAALVSGSESEWPLRAFSLLIFCGVVGLIVPIADRYKRIVLTEDRLSVGRDSFFLLGLEGPVITGEEAVRLAGSIASAPWTAKENERFRLLGGAKATSLGQQPVLVRHKKSEKLLVIGSWRPEEFAAALERCMAVAEPGQWSD